MERRIVVAALLTASVAVACGSDQTAPPPLTTGSDASVSDNVVIADDGLAADARVGPDAVVVTTSGHEDAIAKLHVGSIIASRRSYAHPDQNPYGFLRKVVSITTNGADTVITTSPATLADAIEHGRFDVHLHLDPPGTVSVGTRALHPLGLPPPGGLMIPLPDVTVLDTGVQNVSGGSVVASGAATVRLVGNSLRLTAEPEISGAFDGFSITQFQGALTVGYDATSTLLVTAEGQVGQTLGDKTLGEFDLGHGFFFAGPLPVEVTVKAKVSVGCELTVGGKVEASAKWHAFGTPQAGAHYDHGQWSPVGNPTDFTLETETEVKSEAKVSLKCSMPVELDMFLYDAIGPFAAIAPVVEVSATSTSCTPPSDRLAIDVYDELRLGAKVEILDHTLASWYLSKATPPVHIYPRDAEAATCPDPNDCTTDTECGAQKACAWDGKKHCCRTPVPSAGATKCLADSECPSGQVCGWNLEYFVCQAPACN